MIDLAAIIGDVARLLLGAANERLSSKDELRYGKHGSLSIDLKKGVWNDHEAGAGGGTLDLIAREGHDPWEWLRRNGFTEPRGNGRREPGRLGAEVAWYNYEDEAGVLLFQVVRFEPKNFRQRRPDSSKPNGWDWSVAGARQVPYHLSELSEAIASEHVVFVVEGEKDVETLRSAGVPATTNAGGAGKWKEELNKYFRDADIVVIADNDPQAKKPDGTPRTANGKPVFPGQDHAWNVCENLNGIAKRVRLLDLARYWPDMPPKADVSDWIARGGTVEELYEIIAELPPWSPGMPAPGTPTLLEILSKADFTKGFLAPDYLIDGILQRRFIYALTGQTGHAKTAIALLIAERVSSADKNVMFGTHRVEKGRVIYFVGENPDDVRMRVIGSDSKRTDNPELDNISFIPSVFNVDQMRSVIDANLRENGEAALIIIDTSAAYFPGNEELSNTQMGEYARMLRKYTKSPGGPCVLVLCHPIKHVQETSQLLPRGGGAYLAEMDGNLTLWRLSDDVVELHHGKIRGPGFQAMSFKLETIRDCPKLKDKKGRIIPTVRAIAISQKEEEQRLNQLEVDEDRVLAAMLAKPATAGGSFAQWATDIGWTEGNGEAHKKKVERIIGNLSIKKPKLTVKMRNKWTLTDEGKEAAREAGARFARAELVTSQQSMSFT